MRLVAILSPFAGQQRRNIEYARRAMLDSLKRGEAPYASHLLYPQVLNDLKAKDREMGMEVGRAWMECADAVVVYADLGLSSGMLRDLEGARLAGLEVEVRMIGKAKRKRTKKPAEDKADPKPAKKAGKKKTSKKATSPSTPGKRRTRDQLREGSITLVRAAPKGLTKGELRDALHCSGATLTRILDELVKHGELELKGEKRKARYHRAASDKNGAEDAINDAVAEVTG